MGTATMGGDEPAEEKTIEILPDKTEASETARQTDQTS
jgi:hypothetical protein